MSEFNFSDTDQALWLSHFDIKGVFIGSGLTVIPKNTGLPANTTTVKCEPHDGFTGIWNGTSWDYVRDNRGVRYWNKYGVGSVVVDINDIIPDDAIFIEPPKKEPGFVYLFENGEWQQYQDKVGQKYYSQLGDVLYIDTPYFTLPAGCTFMAPPEEKKGYAPQWTDTEWVYVEDHRGQKVYSTLDKQPRVVQEVGPIDSVYTLLPPNSSYDEWVGDKWVKNLAAEKEGYIETARTIRTNLRVEADSQISVLSDAIKFGDPTEKESELFEAWSKYRVLLSRVDVSTAPDIEWPNKPEGIY